MLTLGLELISSEMVALAELVKNGFDADATTVLVKLLVDPNSGAQELLILDDGSGMSQEVMQTVWLEPATPSRRKRPTSAGGRRSLGEKGLGRFAIAKLSEQVTVTSRAQSARSEHQLTVDWLKFEDEDAFLDSIQIPFQSISTPVFFTENGAVEKLWRQVARTYELQGRSPLPNPTRGTLIHMTHLRTEWTQALVADIQRALSRLVSPAAKLAESQSDFQIVLDLPSSFGRSGGVIEPAAELSRPDYRLDADVDIAGNARIVTRVKNDERSFVDHKVLLSTDGGPLSCGPFGFRILAWDRGRESLLAAAGAQTSYQDMRQALDASAGVSVYRDGFRVLPYGETGNDWLGLDKRRIDSPSKRLSNNQVIGAVQISKDLNPELADQTNREGLVAGQAYSDFQRSLLEIITTLERRRADDRTPSGKRPPPKVIDVFNAVRLDDLKAALEGRHEVELAAMVDSAQDEIDEHSEAVREVVARYQRLATLGQLVDKMIHEVGQPVASIRASAVSGLEFIADFRDQRLTIKEYDDELIGRLETEFTFTRKQARIALDVLSRLAPFGGRRRGRPQVISVEQTVNDVIKILQSEIARSKAVVSVVASGDTLVTVDGTELQEIVLNLLSNSLHWVPRGPRSRKRAINVAVFRDSAKNVIIEVSDSGPGVPEEDRKRIFEPYFTTREGGHGLGLSIAGEIVSDYYGGDLDLVSPGPLGGALFRVILRRRVR